MKKKKWNGKLKENDLRWRKKEYFLFILLDYWEKDSPSLNYLCLNLSRGRLLKNKCEIHWKSTGLPFEIRWTSPGSPVEVQWKSSGSPLDHVEMNFMLWLREVHWKSNGSPVEVQWTSLKSAKITTFSGLPLDLNWKSSGSPMDLVTYFLIVGLW